jgi:uncharacterized protein (DUF4415 family)
MKPTFNPEMIDEENPEWTDEMFAQAELMTKVDPELVEMSKSLCSKPKADNSKRLLSIHYSPEVIEFFKSTGKGWQARMDEVLRNYVASHNKISGEYHAK